MHTRICDRWTLEFPDLPDLGGWDVWEYWERERFLSMEEHLTPTDMLIDVGTEFGGLSAVLAQFVGADRMMLVEPEPTMWPTIRAVFERNGFPPPARSIVGLMADETLIGDAGIQDVDGWPAASEGVGEDDLEGRRVYRYLHDSALTATPQMTVDDTVRRTGRVPTALNIDVEGAELRVLRGASTLLDFGRPLVWVSVHADLMERDYGDTPETLAEFMGAHGYAGTHLATDHEAHWLYVPRDRSL